MKKLLISTLLLTISSSYARSEHKKVYTAISGMVGLAHFGETSALTFGGPQVAAKLGDFTAAVSFYPSLLRSDLSDYETRPSLGFGAEVTYKKLVLFVPTYYVGDKYRTVVGLGYRF